MVYTSRNSLDDPQWSLQPQENATYYPLPVIKTPDTFKSCERKAKTMLQTFQAEYVGPKEESS
jgi:hypothetical protein